MKVPLSCARRRQGKLNVPRGVLRNYYSTTTRYAVSRCEACSGISARDAAVEEVLVEVIGGYVDRQEMRESLAGRRLPDTSVRQAYLTTQDIALMIAAKIQL